MRTGSRSGGRSIQRSTASRYPHTLTIPTSRLRRTVGGRGEPPPVGRTLRLGRGGSVMGRLPDLPIKLGPCSNGEFRPPPVSPVVREAARRAHDEAERTARRLGMSRRRFLTTLWGSAVTLLAVGAC